MNMNEVGVSELRFIGDCPWCGERAILLRDFLCYHALEPCCHTLYRLLPTKVLIALRRFPSRRVNTETQFDELIGHFNEVIHKDKRFLEEYENEIARIKNHLNDHGDGFEYYLKFLVRIYVLRKKIRLLTEKDFFTQHCAMCGRVFQDTMKQTICSTCVDTLGAPPDAILQEQSKPLPEKKKVRGMYTR